jgi:Zn-finger nucleic acid-binding protein
MRLLVACQKCGRQFEVGERPIGSRFRCYCGAVVTVRRPNGHEAAVVRCSSCGAPRQEGGGTCAYCGADFTTHEKDLDTVCPRCFARVSDAAKFCHHCGVAITPETLPVEKTSLACPVCGKTSRLANRQIEGVAFLECGRCAGFWVAKGMFEQLVERAAKNSLGPDWRLPDSPQADKADYCERQSGPMYRKCPACDKLMCRTHFGRRSGVIIDSCKDHGAWFDAGELAAILNWVQAGGLAKVKNEEAQEAERAENRKAMARWTANHEPMASESSGDSDGWNIFWALAEIGSMFLR